ncbi:MAG: TetR/AcrR family transcriptional regulator [Xanthobacter sp.]
MAGNSSQQQIYRAAVHLFAERGVSQVTVKDLAQVAGVARGTIYNNIKDMDQLFEDVGLSLASDMNDRVIRSCGDLADPAVRLATGMRLYVRRAHQEPDWGRFVHRFGFSITSMKGIWNNRPLDDLRDGIRMGRYSIQNEQLTSAISFVAGTTIGAIYLVLEGANTWRAAGSDAAELTLTGLGVPRHEARAIAAAELPQLVSSEAWAD